MSANGFETVCAGNSRCSIRFSDQTLNVRLSGEIDQSGAATLRESIDRAAESCLPQTLLMDFSGVSFMDSSGIGLIMGRYRLMQTMGGELLVAGASPRVRRLMQLGGLDRLPLFGRTPERPRPSGSR